MTRAQQWALIATLVILGLVVVSSGGIASRAGPARTDRYAAALGDTSALRVTIAQGAGTLRVHTIETDQAYEATITRDARARVRVDYRRGRLTIRDGSRGFPARRISRVPQAPHPGPGPGRRGADRHHRTGGAWVCGCWPAAG